MRTAQEQLVHMVNQICENNSYGTVEDAANIASTHMKKFWARSMKQDIVAYLESDGSALTDAAKQAVAKL